MAVVLFPILKRQNESLALGYVAARLVECTFIAIGIGIVSLLAVVTLRQKAAGADAVSLVTAGKSLVASVIGRSYSGQASLSAWKTG